MVLHILQKPTRKFVEFAAQHAKLVCHLVRELPYHSVRLHPIQSSAGVGEQGKHRWSDGDSKTTK